MRGVLCVYNILLLFGLTAVLSGCVGPPRPTATIDSKVNQKVFDLAPEFSPKNLPENWVFEGSSDAIKNQIQVTEKNGVKSLKIMNSKDNFIVAKPSQAMLLATPYLTWAWNMEPHGLGYHPARVVIGFRGGDKSKTKSLTKTNGTLPPYERIFAINWADTALKRGVLTKPSADGRSAPHYTIRGGRENANTWWLEVVDMSRLYAQVWPNDTLSTVEVVFIGVAVAGGRQPAAAYISEIKLTR